MFVTAFDQHAIEAFEVNAVDYLLKPVEAGRLETAVERVAAARRPAGAEPAERPSCERIVQLVAGPPGTAASQLAVKVGERFLLVQADEVVHASVEDDVD